MAPGEKKTRLLETSATRWGQHDIKASTEWIATIPDAALQRKLLTRAIVGQACFDPQPAAELLLQRLPAGEERDRGMVTILSLWVVDHGVETAALWIGTLPDEKIRLHILAQLVDVWKQRDAGPPKWISSLPDGRLQMAAVELFRSKAATP
jgi:hypothetical protein